MTNNQNHVLTATEKAQLLALRGRVQALEHTLTIGKLLQDPNPQLSGNLDANFMHLIRLGAVGFGKEWDYGESGATATIDFSKGNNWKIELTANCTLTFVKPFYITHCQLTVLQDGTGSRTLTHDSDVEWTGSSAPTLSTGAADEDILSFYFNGSKFKGVMLPDFG